MARVTVSLTDSILHKVDEEANKAEITRSEYVASAIESQITGSNQASITLHNLELELNKSQTEVMQQKRQITKLENTILEKNKAIESKAKDVMQADEKVNQAYADLNNARLDAGKYEMAFKAKDEEISFLRGYLSQLSERLTPQLPPSEDEAKSKHWYQFWK